MTRLLCANVALISPAGMQGSEQTPHLYPVGFNPATRISPERRALAASGIVAVFKHLWSDSWGPRLEHFLFHGLAALVSREHATLIDLARLYTDDRFGVGHRHCRKDGKMPAATSFRLVNIAQNPASRR